MTVLSRVYRPAAAALHCRAFSSMATGPTMHKATGKWVALKNSRPIDADDLHTTLDEPSERFVFWAVFGGAAVGYGLVALAARYQNKKQGFK